MIILIILHDSNLKEYIFLTFCLMYSELQIAAKINPQGTQNIQDPNKKRSLEDSLGKN